MLVLAGYKGSSAWAAAQPLVQCGQQQRGSGESERNGNRQMYTGKRREGEAGQGCATAAAGTLAHGAGCITQRRARATTAAAVGQRRSSCGPAVQQLQRMRAARIHARSSLLLQLLQDALVAPRNQPVPLIHVGGLGLAVERVLHGALQAAGQGARGRGRGLRGRGAWCGAPRRRGGAAYECRSGSARAARAWLGPALRCIVSSTPAGLPWRPQMW